MCDSSQHSVCLALENLQQSKFLRFSEIRWKCRCEIFFPISHMEQLCQETQRNQVAQFCSNWCNMLCFGEFTRQIKLGLKEKNLTITLCFSLAYKNH